MPEHVLISEIEIITDGGRRHRCKADALLHHSDQDSQYTSEQFQRLLLDHGITCSMNLAPHRPSAHKRRRLRRRYARVLEPHANFRQAVPNGRLRGNSAMESFFSSMKTERTARKVYRTRDAARADVFDYIERFYNPRRRHSKPSYLSPMAFEDRAMQT